MKTGLTQRRRAAKTQEKGLKKNIWRILPALYSGLFASLQSLRLCIKTGRSRKTRSPSRKKGPERHASSAGFGILACLFFAECKEFAFAARQVAVLHLRNSEPDQ